MGVKVREEQRLRVSEIRMLTKIFGSKMEEVTGGWSKLRHSYSSTNSIRVIKSGKIR